MEKHNCALTGIPCPENSDPSKGVFCPLYCDKGDHYIERNTVTGEERIQRCGAAVMVKGQIEVIKASNRPAAAIESVRNEMVEGLQAGFSKVSQVVAYLGAKKQIEDKG